MPDNMDVTPGTGRTIAGDEIAGALHQRIKLTVGPDGSASDVHDGNPLPGKITDGTNAITLDPSTADSETTGGVTLPTQPRLMGFNGSTWDRLRAGLNGVQTAFTGLLNVLPLARYNATPPTLSDGNAVMLQADASGNLKVNIAAGGGGGGTEYTEGDVDTSITGSAIMWEDTGNTLRPASAATPLPVSQQGSSTVQFASAQPVTVSGTPAVTVAPGTTGGLSITRDLDLDEASPAVVKASAGQVFSLFAINNANAFRYIKIYDKATAPTVGTDTPILTIPVPAFSGVNLYWQHGVAFANGIGWAATTGLADSDTGAPAANDIVAHLGWK